jgi:cell division protein FtsB
MKQRLKREARRAATKVAPGVVASLDRRRQQSASQSKQIDRLRRRIAALEGEVQECRALNRRVAELTDIVQELVVPAARRDEARLEEALRQYADRL